MARRLGYAFALLLLTGTKMSPVAVHASAPRRMNQNSGCGRRGSHLLRGGDVR
jgi:hypothetical protein